MFMSSSVKRTFMLLELLGNADQSLGVSALAQQSQLPLGTVHRLLNTQKQLGYVEQDAETHKYTLGLRFLNLRGAIINQLNLAAVAMPVMKELMQRVNETVHLAVFNEGEIVYIERVEGLNTQGMYTRIGKRAPAHCTALGKTLLAHMPCEIVTDVLARHGMRRMTAKTIVTPQALEQDLERTRQRGFAVDDEEIEDGIRCIAAPIRDYTDAVCAAISISGPKTRVRADREAELSKAVIWAASLISTKLGYLGSQ